MTAPQSSSPDTIDPRVQELADKIRNADCIERGAERFAVLNIIIGEGDREGFANAILRATQPAAPAGGESEAAFSKWLHESGGPHWGQTTIEAARSAFRAALATPSPIAQSSEGESACPCGAGEEPCPGPDGKPLCATPSRSASEGESGEEVTDGSVRRGDILTYEMDQEKGLGKIISHRRPSEGESAVAARAPNRARKTDSTCYVERSMVRIGVMGTGDEALLKYVDALPIFTASDFANPDEPACGDYSQASQRHNGDLQPGSSGPNALAQPSLDRACNCQEGQCVDGYPFPCAVALSSTDRGTP